MKINQFLGIIKPWILSLGIFVLFVSCLEEEKKASLVFFHHAPSFGLLDVVVNDQVLDQVDPNRFGKNVGITTGDNTIQIKESGEDSSIAQTTINAQAQQYVVVFKANENNDPNLIKVTQAPNNSDDPNMHYIEVLNLSDNPDGIKIFVNAKNILDNPALDTVSSFIAVDPIEQASLGVSLLDEENTPLATDKQDLNAGIYSLLLVYGSGTNTQIKWIEITDINQSL
jgi:hypothetical protein